MSELRNRFLKKAVCPERFITAAGERFLIIGTSAKARNDLYSSINQGRDSADPDRKMTGEELTRLEAEIVILCTYDPDTRQPVFSRADRDTLMNMPGEVLSALSAPAFELSGWANKKDLAKNA
jgi:hypothetical protein